MIDPKKITNYNLTVPELEEHLLFWVCAAGKNGHTAARGLELFLTMITYNNMSPFEAVRNAFKSNKKWPEDLPSIDLLLKRCGIGCYTRKAKTILQLAFSGLDLRSCSTEDLENIYGIGMKTSRCFIMHSRKDTNCAGLDTHMLKYLRELGYEAPLTTPSSKKKYLEFEKIVLSLAIKADETPAEFDLEVWNRYAVIPKKI